MEFQIAGGEIFLRVIAIFLLVLTACLIAFDTQTKVVFLTIEKKVTYKDVDALRILLYVSSSAAGYNLLQLCKHSCPSIGSYDMSMVWISLLFDQIAVYLTFATNSALFQAALFALSGSEAFQWLKVCNKFTRFCEQIAGAILCCFVATILMAMISIISAYKVFRMYSPKRFLRLKGK